MRPSPLLFGFCFVLQGEDETTLHVLQDPFYDQKLLVSTEGGVLTTSDTIELDSTTLTAFRRTESITVPKGTVVVVDILSTSIEARFALRTGDRQYSFWQTTVGFPVLVQRVRVWCFRFYYPFIYGGLCLLFFLSWPVGKWTEWKVGRESWPEGTKEDLTRLWARGRAN